MRRFYCATFVLFALFSLQLSAQTGKYDLNLALSYVDFDNMKLYVDIQIKAHERESVFRVSDQNYRIVFNDALVYNSAFIEQELEVSGHILSSTGHSWYQPHTLTGSLDSIVSYNIEFASGEGLLIQADEWTNVGQIGFDIADITGTVNIMYLEENMFPPTFIGEFYDETRMEVNLSSYFDTEDPATDSTDSDDCSSEGDSPVGVINPKIENSVNLYPTLANDFIYLHCGDNIYGDLRIIDVQGRVIQHWQEGQNLNSVNHLDISALPSGRYFLQMNINEYYLTRRFIKI